MTKLHNFKVDKHPFLLIVNYLSNTLILLIRTNQSKHGLMDLPMFTLMSPNSFSSKTINSCHQFVESGNFKRSCYSWASSSIESSFLGSQTLAVGSPTHLWDDSFFRISCHFFRISCRCGFTRRHFLGSIN